MELISKKFDYLRTSLPTAVNLFRAMDEIMFKLKSMVSESSDSDSENTVDSVIHSLEHDVSDKKSIGEHGSDELLKAVGA